MLAILVNTVACCKDSPQGMQFVRWLVATVSLHPSCSTSQLFVE
jgi:hypothetical protein